MLTQLALGVLGGIAIWRAIATARRCGRVLNFSSLLLINFAVSVPISGLAHLAASPQNRGYFDLVARGDGELTTAVIASFAGLVGLLVGTGKGPSAKLRDRASGQASQSWLTTRDRGLLVLAAICILPVALLASTRVQAFVSQVEEQRVLTFPPGLAIYVVMASWMTWTIAFVALALTTRTYRRAQLAILLIATVAVALIFASVSWTGGRTIGLVLAAPLLITLLSRVPSYRAVALFVGLVLLIQTVLSISVQRGAVATSPWATAMSWADWQWGRFSMLGFAASYTQDHGFFWGETFAASAWSLSRGALAPLGFELPASDLPTVLATTGAALTGDPQRTTIVPGLGAELYLNFGLVGVAIGFLLLARATRWVDDRFASSQTAIPQLFYANLGCLLVLRTITAESGAFLNYLIYIGGPLIVVAGVRWLITPDRERDRCDRSTGAPAHPG